MAMPNITLLSEPPKAIAITMGNTNGGKARNASDILIIVSSTHLLETPAINPKGTPSTTDISTTPIATLRETKPPRIVSVNISLPAESVPKICENDGA